MAATIDFRLLGPVEARRDAERLELGGAKRRALLALLLLRPNEAVPADRLVLDLWGDAAPETAANTLQVNVSQLRKALGKDRIVRDAGGYVLRVEPGELDVERFDGAVARGRDALAAHDFDAAVAAFDEALALWHGAPLADVSDEPFAAAERARLEEARAGVVEDRFEALLGLGGGSELVPELEALLAADPYRERLHGQLMLALYRAGRQADALDLYKRARRILVDELGIEPSPPLRRLEQAILAQDPALDPSRRSRLPAPLTALVGREDELVALEALLREGARLVTLTGPGGIGKTRLALEAARRAEAHFADGAVFVALTDIDQPELVAPSILQALGLAPATDPKARLVDELRGRSLLLVLDNFEQVIEGAAVVASVLETAPDVAALATSRELLRVAGEREFEVPPLGADDGVQLFVHRAADLQATTDDEGAIAEICERLEGLPLAIELAAARVRLLPPPALLARLTSRLELLRGSRRDAPERQRTMRGTIEWSYRLLAPDEQVLFARLGVFAGGATLDAVETVCGDVATLESLGSLVDKSLVRQLGVDEPRFRMLETLREYALEQLEAMGELEGVRRRHMDYFAAFVAQSEPEVVGRNQRVWLDRLERDHANIRLAIATALELGEGVTATEIAGDLRVFWYVHGHAEEGLRVLEAALAAASDAPPLALTKAHNGAAMLASDRGDYVVLRHHLERSLELARELDDPIRVGVSQMNLGNAALFEEEWDEATRLYEESLAIFRKHEDLRLQSIALENLGNAVLAQGDIDRAVTIFEESLDLAIEAEAPHPLGSAQLALARALTLRGEFERARTLLDATHEIFTTLDAGPRLADTLEGLAGLAASERDWPEAARLLGSADAQRRAIGAVRQPDQERWVAAVVEEVRGALGDSFDAEFAVGATRG